MSWLLIIGLKNAILVAPLAVLALALGRYSKRPALAHVLWLIVLVKLLTPPLIDVPVGFDLESLVVSGDAAPADPRPLPPPTALDVAPVSDVACDPLPNEQGDSSAVSIAACPTDAPTKPAASAPISAARIPPPLRSPVLWLTLAGVAWIFGSVVVALLLAARAWRFHRFVRLAARVDDRLAARVAKLAQSVGLCAGPQVVVVEGVVSPMLWGVGAGTRLIFPAQLARRLNDAEVDSLLLHELAHYCRGDHWVRLLELAAHVLYWWHPAVWFARREIEAAEEQCCDAWVVEHQHGSRRSYAEALLTTIDFLSEPDGGLRSEPQTALPPAACGLGEVPLLRLRLTQIMRGQLAGGLSRRVQAIVLCIGVVISPLQPALWATSSPALPQPELIVIPPAPATPAAPALDSETASAPSLVPPVESAEQISESTTTVAASPLTAVSPLRWSARSPDHRFRLEFRKSGETTLIREGTLWQKSLNPLQVRCAAFSPDGRTFVTGLADGTIRWWDCETGGHLNTLGDKSGEIRTIAFGPSNQVAAGTGSGTVAIYDLISGAETRVVCSSPVACVRWSADGQRLAIGLGDYRDTHGAVLVWDVNSPVQPAETLLPEPVGALSWLDDASLLVANWSGQSRVLQPATGELTPGQKLDKTLVSAANWSPDCPLVAPYAADKLALEVAR